MSLVPALRTNTSSVEGAKMTPLVPTPRTNNDEQETNPNSVESAKMTPLVPTLRTNTSSVEGPKMMSLQGWVEVLSAMMDSKGEPGEEMPSHVTILDAAGC